MINQRADVKFDCFSLSKYKTNPFSTIRYETRRGKMDSDGAIFMRDSKNRVFNVWSLHEELRYKYDWGAIYYLNREDFRSVAGYIRDCCSQASAIWKRYEPFGPGKRIADLKKAQKKFRFCKNE